MDVAAPDDRYPAWVESAAYFVVAEALTNVAKYARAGAAAVSAQPAGGRLVVTIQDDGVGGAQRRPGGGLAGLEDRMAALGGTLAIDSAPRRGTVVRATIPLDAAGPGRAPV